MRARSGTDCSGDQPRLAVVGLDGVRLDVLERFRDSLPFLSDVMSTGAAGDLRSVLPGPHSGPAWTSFGTGLNPGEHGIGDWRVRDGYEFRPASGADVPHYRFWDYLSDAGYTVGVFNIPLTAPPYPVNGVVVTSWTTGSNEWAYPATFQDDLEAIGYVRKADFGSPDDDVGALQESIVRRRRAFELFTEAYDWNLLVGMFYETEQAHHQFAPFLDPDHSEYDPADERTVRTVYETVDRELRKLSESLGDVPMLVVSDHGFCPLYERITVNRILEQYGYYAPPTDPDAGEGNQRISERLRDLAVELGTSSSTVKRIAHALTVAPVIGGAVETVVGSVRPRAYTKRVEADWSETVAFCGYEHGGIFVNREELPAGTVEDEAVADLVESIVDDLEHDEYLQSRVRGVHRREDLFSGDRIEQLPEIVVDFADGYLGSSGYLSKRSRGPGELLDQGKNVAFHTMDGVLLATGDDVATTKVDGASIVDVAPTVLQYFGVAIPENADGRPLTELFEPGSRVHDAVRTTTPSYHGEARRALPEPAQDDVERRLREMGYR